MADEGRSLDAEVGAVLHPLDRAAWSLAAIVAAIRSEEPAALEVVEALGVRRGAGEEWDRLASLAAAPLLQASTYIRGGGAWAAQDDEALLAQGRGSAATGAMFPRHVIPQLPGGPELLERPVQMLDVGVGVAAMAVALCQHMPNLSIVGLEVLPRPLELARRAIDDAGLGARIELRLLSVADLEDVDRFDLAWLPAPFIPYPALRAGAERVARALRPGGWVLLGHGRFDGDRLDVVVTRFKTVAYGGTPLTDAEAGDLLGSVGLVDIMHLHTPPGAPALTAARRPQT